MKKIETFISGCHIVFFATGEPHCWRMRQFKEKPFAEINAHINQRIHLDEEEFRFSYAFCVIHQFMPTLYVLIKYNLKLNILYPKCGWCLKLCGSKRSHNVEACSFMNIFRGYICSDVWLQWWRRRRCRRRRPSQCKSVWKRTMNHSLRSINQHTVSNLCGRCVSEYI